MWKTFKDDTALTAHQVDLIRSRYDELKDFPLYLSMVKQAVVLIEKQDNRALFLLFDKGFKEMGPLYPLVLIYSLYPTIVALYDRLGISNPVRQATLSDIAIWVKTYEDQHSGATGLAQYGWICRHLCAKVIRLGRLQFEQGFFRFPHFIYYDTKHLSYRTFAQEDIVCNPEGYIGNDSDSGTWTTRSSVAEGFLSAHEVDQKKGTISREAVSVPLSTLKLICTQDTAVLSVHIPEGETLAPPLVDASFSMARQMFGPTLFVCDSWLLDPELSQVLHSGSNICHFMRRFKKFPVTFTTPQIYERVFGFGATLNDVLAWKPVTSLQGKVQQHIRGGGIFRTTGGYIPAPACV